MRRSGQADLGPVEGRCRAVYAGLLAFVLLAGVPVASAAGPPQIGPNWTTSVSNNSAVLRAEINPNGLASTYHFSYLPEAAYQANVAAGKDGFEGAKKAPVGADPSIGSGTALVAVFQSVSSLSPSTAYRYRVQAANTSSTEVGPVRLFYTTGGFSLASPLLDNRGWEMVSPPGKGDGQIPVVEGLFGGGVFQAAAGGDAFTYSASTAFGQAMGAPHASQYIARRGANAWLSENVTQPVVAGAFGDEPDGAPYQLFSPDLSRAILADGNRCDPGDPCPRGYSLRVSAGGGLTPSVQRPDLRLAGTSADLSQRVLSTCAALTADAIEVPGPEGCDPAQPNLYRWSAAGLSLVNLLPAAALGSPGATLAAQSGAVSDDGTRVYWKQAGDLFLREGSSTKPVDATVGGGGTFQAASTSGAVAFFTKAAHLYRYDAGAGSATDLTPAGGVEGMLGASASGDYVYYLASTGLFLRHNLDPPVKVADTADSSNYPPATGTARLTPDGTHLAFLSSASLTGYDNRGSTNAPTAQVGVPQIEVYLYDVASANLACVSCSPFGERPLGPSTMPGAIANGKAPTAVHAYKPRTLSDDGRRLFFDSADDLALRDRDRSPASPDPDVYEWEAQGTGSCERPGGCVALISSGRSRAGASFLDASAAGGDVYFRTGESLIDADADFADIYDAREGGGYPQPIRPIECAGDACQPLPWEPFDFGPGTLVPTAGNSRLRVVSEAPVCRKGFVPRHRKCVRKPKKDRHSAKRGASR